MFMFVILALSTAFISTSSTIAQVLDDESCETLQSEVHITKGIMFYSNRLFIIRKSPSRANEIIIYYYSSDEYDEIGRLRRTCSGDIPVTKCEGFCSSQVQPSVASTTGFTKVS